MSLFCCEGICKTYQRLGVVENIDIRLERGEIVGLLGVSGVGKTTLLNILAGVDEPDSGRVLLRGEDVTGRAGRVSYMLQKDLLFEFKTILDNVSLPLLLRGVPCREAHERAGADFARFGLAGYEHKYPHQLSGGMRQRAALLRTCFLGNEVVLLDEPFSALDAFTKAEMHVWFQEMAVQMSLSTIFITHDVDEAVTLSDRIYVMAGVPGRITGEFEIRARKPRAADFAVSDAFLEHKRGILTAIGKKTP